MRTQFDPEDIQAIAERVADVLKPILSKNKAEDRDIIFDIKELAGYLRVTVKWIYEQTSQKKIPHFKMTNKQLRFRKRDIDTWLESLRTPAVSEPTGKLRLLK